MEKEKWYSVLRMFLWEHRWTALMFGVYIAVFTIVFSLYRLETEAVLPFCISFQFYKYESTAE